MICNDCQRKCNVDRSKSLGFCKSGENIKIARASLHFWEEPCISGKNGSGTVFFSGCNLSCVYCQNYKISSENFGVEVDDKKLMKIFDALIKQGANNINLVTPTHYATALIRVLKEYKSTVPIVWNTSGYERVETLKRLEELVDIYLTDYKYTRNEKAKIYSNAPDYPNTAVLAIKEMTRQRKCEFSGDLMTSGVIIRHLILPQNTNTALEVIDKVKENFSDSYLSLMAQYVPNDNENMATELKRKITKREYDKVVDYAINSGLSNVFIQKMESSDKKYIPSFDLSGIL